MTARVGIADVAKAAGVSITTVSHALSGQGKISESTRSRIERAASELGYAPNRIASALRRKRSRIIGFVSDEIATTPFAGKLVLGAQDAAADAGLLLMVVNSNRDPDVERDQIRALLAQQVDGIVYAKMYHQPAVVPATLAQVPTVLVDAYDTSGGCPSVVPDERQIAMTAVGALLEAGHRRIAHLTIAEDTPAKVGRLAGYREALEMAGIEYDPELVVVAPVGPGVAATARAREAFAAFLEVHDAPTAVFSFNDQFAMGVYQAAAGAGLVIPRDLSVVGVDNLEIVAENLAPGLTTVALPHYEMGRWAVEQIVERLRADAEAASADSSNSSDEKPAKIDDPPWAAPMLMVCRLVTRASIVSPAEG